MRAFFSAVLPQTIDAIWTPDELADLLELPPWLASSVSPLVPRAILSALQGRQSFHRLVRLARIVPPGPVLTEAFWHHVSRFHAVSDRKPFAALFLHDRYVPSPAGDPQQVYLSPTPAGVGRSLVEAVPTDLVTLADVEYAWSTVQYDLPQTERIWGDKDEAAIAAALPGEPEHGTRVIGVLSMSADNQPPGSGIAAGFKLLRASSVDDVSAPGPNIPAAIAACLTRLKAGDVLLLEAQEQVDGRYVPAEIVGATWEAVRGATDDGILVVAAAGNGDQDLDLLTCDGHGRVQATDTALDSGSVLVGGGVKVGPDKWIRVSKDYSPTRASNHGARVTCFGQGLEVFTVDPLNDGSYTQFGGTSAAAAIVAGAAAVMSAVAKSKPTQLTAAELRSRLGKGKAAHGGEKIGIMPDLVAIVKAP